MGYTGEQKREYQRKWLADRREAWFAGKSCINCGSTEQLENDHVDPSQKISHRVWSWTQLKREAELAKCQVLCHLCHLAKTRKDFEPPHGTRSRYVHRKCRCEECKAANRNYGRIAQSE